MRLLLALLIACLALPAMAAPHAAHALSPPGLSPPGLSPHALSPHAMATGHGHHHGQGGDEAPAPAQAMPKHECIGCIPPTHGLARFSAAHRFALALRHAAADVPMRPGALSAPATPPPKAPL